MASRVAAKRRRAAEAEAEAQTPAPVPLPFVAATFRLELQRWYKLHARTLPWRGIRNPYATWLSEIMLQQTRVATVIERYEEFLRRFPTISALAKANEDEVLALWSGLGYYRRARMLHRGAQFVHRELGGKLPRTAPALRTLPGVGDYTAAAIASIAFGESIAVIDGNVERVLLRVLGSAEDRSGKAKGRLNDVAQALVPPSAKRRERSNPPGDHNQAMMELGAMICLPRQPLCLECPVMNYCRTRGEHATAVRGKPQSRVVAHLLTLRKRGTATEILLLRRPAQATLMPKMLELPPLPIEATAGREPVLRLRHAITNTNYYVQIFAESAPGVAPLKLDISDFGGEPQLDIQEPASEIVAVPKHDGHRHAASPDARRHRIHRELYGEEPGPEDLHELALSGEDARLTAPEGSLLGQVPSNEHDMQWVSTMRLRFLPLTGLTRKTLQRLGVMGVPRVELG